MTSAHSDECSASSQAAGPLAVVKRALRKRSKHFCILCRSVTTYPHDHKVDESGLDDGPLLGKSQQIAARRFSAQKLADIGFTHDLISQVLGVSRTTITSDLTTNTSEES